MPLSPKISPFGTPYTPGVSHPVHHTGAPATTYNTGIPAAKPRPVPTKRKTLSPQEEEPPKPYYAPNGFFALLTKKETAFDRAARRLFHQQMRLTGRVGNYGMVREALRECGYEEGYDGEEILWEGMEDRDREAAVRMNEGRAAEAVRRGGGENDGGLEGRGAGEESGFGGEGRGCAVGEDAGGLERPRRSGEMSSSPLAEERGSPVAGEDARLAHLHRRSEMTPEQNQFCSTHLETKPAVEKAVGAPKCRSRNGKKATLALAAKKTGPAVRKVANASVKGVEKKTPSSSALVAAASIQAAQQHAARPRRSGATRKPAVVGTREWEEQERVRAEIAAAVERFLPEQEPERRGSLPVFRTGVKDGVMRRFVEGNGIRLWF